MNTYREVTRQGWLGRLGGAFKGVIAGIVLLVVALGLQFWNEGRTVRRDAALNEGRASVQSVAATPPSPALEGRLVHVSGDANAATPVVDEAFGVNVSALALRRRVEMYQWHEKRERKEEKELGGGTRTVTEYRYEQRWNDEAVDSSRFEKSSAYPNPGPLPFEDESRYADEVRLGGFALAPEVAREIDGWIPVASEQVSLPPNLAASFRAADKWFTTSTDPADPQIGDVRVRFELLPAGEVSVVARQQDATLVPHASERGDELLLVQRGTHSAGAMFDDAGTRNSRTGWILRLVGFGLAWIGIGILFKPLVVLADVVPLFGRLAGIGTGIVSAVLAVLVSMVGIGGGWLWHRPWALALLVIAVVALVVWVVRRGRARAPAMTASLTRGDAPPMPHPPPPPPPPASA